MNNITTWQQGKFIYKLKYSKWSIDEVSKAKEQESIRVRPGPEDNAICICTNPQDALWIASRLNLASKLEQMTYDYAMTKISGAEIIDFVRKHMG